MKITTTKLFKKPNWLVCLFSKSKREERERWDQNREERGKDSEHLETEGNITPVRDIVYLVLQWYEEAGQYEIGGVFDQKHRAVAACRDDSYVIGEFGLNQTLPHESTPGTWYDHHGTPLANKE